VSTHGGARHLLIGLDGAGLDLVRQLGAERLPHIHALLARGVCAPLRSVQPPATLPNWTTLLTGENPGVHGVFDFTTRSGYSVRFTAGSVRETPTIAARLDRLGLSCACLFFPGTFPPERLEHGVFISGWDAPVAFEADRSFVWPAALHGEIVQRFGPQRFDDVDEFDADSLGWHARLPAALVSRVQRRTELATWLLQQRSWDLFAVYFGESDTAAHHLWSLHDPCSPRRPAHVSHDDQQGLARVYQALDRAVGELVYAAGGSGVEVTLVSDHGSGGASDKVLYLNRVLEDAGFLRFRAQSGAPSLVRSVKELALTRLPPKLRERLFRGFGAVLPGWLESRARFAAIDMPHTRVFSDELNYFPALHWNLRGREPRGTLEPSAVPEARAQLEQALLALRDPWTGEQVVRAVHAREELFAGPHVGRAPDLLLELATSGGYSYNLMPSAGAPSGTGPFRRLSADEYLGRKGRSLPGSHRPTGLFVAAGPELAARGEVDAAMADVTATLLARMKIRDGARDGARVLEEVLRGQAREHTLPDASIASARRDDGARIEARLRRLGYIE
jgi:predicted AlkP superfamily phosphohydrolase/phosphomutase